MTFINLHQVKTSQTFVVVTLDPQLQMFCSTNLFLGAPHYLLILIFYTWGVLVDLFEKHTHYLN